MSATTRHTCKRVQIACERLRAQTSSSGLTKTRIDRVYAPDTDGLLWEHKPITVELFPRPQGAVILDHEPAQIVLKQVTHKRGKAISFVNESIYDDAPFVGQLGGMIKSAMQNYQGDWSKTWMSIKEQARNMSVAETRKVKSHKTREEKELHLRIKNG